MRTFIITSLIVLFIFTILFTIVMRRDIKLKQNYRRKYEKAKKIYKEPKERKYHL